MPVQVSNGVLATTDLAGNKFAGVFTLDTFLTNATDFSSRLANVAGFKFKKLCFRLQTSCPANYNGIVGVSAWPRVSANNLAFSDRADKLSQCAMETMFLPQDNAVEIKLPWLYPYDAYDNYGYQVPTTDPVRGMWQITPYVISPLRYGTGGIGLGFEVYMWLEGFETLVTTAQSGSEDCTEIKLGVVPVEKPSVSEDARSVVRGAIGLGSKVWPSALWDLARGVSTMMGLSNPRVDSETISVIENLTSGGDRKCKMLGNLQDESAVASVEGDYDPLSFAALGSVPHLALETTIGIGTAAALLLNYELSPFKSNKTAALNVNSVTAPSALIASLFSQWRGDCRVTVMVGHSKQNVRFRLTYVPWKKAFGVLTESEKSCLPSHIFATGETGEDGEATTSWSFDIPYCAPTQYLYSSTIVDANGVNEDGMGHIVLETLNGVTGPDICGDINVAVFISWHNMVCTGWNANNTNYGPIFMASQQATPESGDVPVIRGVANSGLLDDFSDAYPLCDGRMHIFHRRSKKISFGRSATAGHGHLEVDSVCGYPITSFRQVIQKLLDVNFVGAFNRNAQSFAFMKCEFYDDGASVSGNLMGDLVSMLRGMFSYETGSLSIGTFPNLDANRIVLENASFNDAGTVANFSPVPNVVKGQRVVETFPTTAAAIVAKVPRYSKAKMTPLTPATNNGTVQFLSSRVMPSQPLNWTNVLVSDSTGATSQSAILRGGGEDYNLYWRRPIPTMYSSVAFS